MAGAGPPRLFRVLNERGGSTQAIMLGASQWRKRICPVLTQFVRAGKYGGAGVKITASDALRPPFRRMAFERCHHACLQAFRCLWAGTDAWLLIHIEVEGRLPGRKALRIFAWRMYEYRHRIQGRIMAQHDLELPPPIYSLGVLLENRGVGDHLRYVEEHLGQGVIFTFPVVELESWRDRWDALESLAPSNPFAVLMMAQLRANQFPDKRARLGPKFDLVRGLQRYGYDPDVARQIHHLVDWMIKLPADLEPDYVRAVTALKEEKAMTYVTSIERVVRKQAFAEGQAEGHTEGQVDALLSLIQHRFGTVNEVTMQQIRAADSVHLATWLLNTLDADTLEDVFRD